MEPPAPEEFRLLLRPAAALVQIAEQRRHIEAALSSRATDRRPRSVPLAVLFPPPEGPSIITDEITAATGEKAAAERRVPPSAPRP